MSTIGTVSSARDSVRVGLDRLGRGGAQHVLVAALARLLGFLGVAILIQHLGTRGFGIYAVALLNEQVLFILFGYALVNAIGRFFSDARRGLRQEEVVIGTTLVSVVVLGVVGGAVWQLAAAPIARLTLSDSSTAVSVSRLVGISVVGSLVLSVVTTIWQLEVRMRAFAIANLAQYGLGALAGAAAVIGWGAGATGAFAGWAVATLGTAVWAVVWLLRHYHLRFSGSLLREMLRYGLPLAPGALVMLVLQVNDRYVVRLVGGLGDVGIYSAVITVAAGLSAVVVVAFKRIWAALMWGMREQPGEEEFHRRVLTYYAIGQTWLVLGLAVFGDAILSLMSGGEGDFVAVGGAIAVAYFGFALFGAYDVLSAGYFFSGRTVYYTISVSVATAVSIAFNLALVPTFGIWAAASSNPVAYAILAFLSWRFGRRYFPVRFEWARITLVIALGAAVGLAALAARTQLGSPLGYPVAAGCVAAFPLIAYMCGGLDPGARYGVRRTLHRLVHRDIRAPTETASRVG